MPAFRQAKQLLRRAFLRGPVLRLWNTRKSRKLESAYCAELVRAAAGPLATPTAPAFTATAVLRSILFIADCMWEMTELVPELQKIAAVTVLDLRPGLRIKSAAKSDRESVAAMVKDFAAEQKGLSPDVILFYARPALLVEEAFHHLRQRWKCPLFGMNLDDKTQFFPYGIFSVGDDDYQRWAGQFDLNLTSSLAAAEWYHQHNLPGIYVPMGFHPTPAVADPPAAVDYEHSLSFVGSWKPERGAIIDRLLKAGVPIALFGNGWPKARWVDEAAQVYRRSQLNLGIGYATAAGGITSLKARDFECPGAGACYLTTYNWELANLYDIGREILCYRSAEELLEIYGYYVKRPQACLRIAQAAHRRCAAEHTWEKRFRKIFRETGFKV